MAVCTHICIIHSNPVSCSPIGHFFHCSGNQRSFSNTGCQQGRTQLQKPFRLPWYVRQFVQTITSHPPCTAATLWITTLTRCSPAQTPPVLVVMFLQSSHSFSPHPHLPTGTMCISPHAPLSWTVKPAPPTVLLTRLQRPLGDPRHLFS